MSNHEREEGAVSFEQVNIEEATQELLTVGRNEGPPLLRTWWECNLLTRRTLRELVPLVWSVAEWPIKSIGERAWVSMFKEAGFVSDTPSETQPASPLTIYRGAPRWKGPRGMSWSLDVERARFFARRIAILEPANVYRATVPPGAVLAILNDRNEQEVVVNPNMLQGRTTPIEAIDPSA